MNTPNPLIPQGSLLEQKAKGKPHLRVALAIVVVHLLFLGGLLIQGCKKEDTIAKSNQPTSDIALPPLDQTNLYPTNTGAQQTNPLQQDLTLTSPQPGASLPQLPQTPAEQQGAAIREYVVVKGDSFYTLGRKFAVPLSAIAKANPGVDPTRLKIGQKLVIPAPASPNVATASVGNSSETVYVVKTGDTLLKIANGNPTMVKEIKTLNGLKTDLIRAGDKLKLPAAKPAPATATPAATNPGAPTAPPPSGTANL